MKPSYPTYSLAYRKKEEVQLRHHESRLLQAQVSDNKDNSEKKGVTQIMNYHVYKFSDHGLLLGDATKILSNQIEDEVQVTNPVHFAGLLKKHQTSRYFWRSHVALICCLLMTFVESLDLVDSCLVVRHGMGASR
jgi:hypothetical protein